MELVEGEDLAERLKRGAMPVDEALAIARQIAEALEEAHEKGIVHRDLKPANIKAHAGRQGQGPRLRPRQGLEPATGSARRSSGDLSQSPTLARTGTRAGLILGTAAYMAPEQARGKPVDKRADIWAFGVAALRDAHRPAALRRRHGDATCSPAVLRQEIDWKALPAATPAALRRLLARCLERNPKNRLHDIADARIALDELLRGADRDEPPLAVAQTRRLSRASCSGAACAALALAALAGLLTRGLRREAERSGARASTSSA